MTKPAVALSTTALVVNLVLIVLTMGAWLLPFGIYILMMWSQKKKPSILLTAVHTVLSMFGGIWLLVIIIWYIAKKK